MRKHGGTPSWRDKHATLAAISPPGVARGRFVGGQQSGLAGCKPPPLFTRGASSCSSQGRRQGEPWGASPRPSAPTYLPHPPVRLFALSVVDVLGLLSRGWTRRTRLSVPGASLGRAHGGPSPRGDGRRQVNFCYHLEGPYQDRPLPLYPWCGLYPRGSHPLWLSLGCCLIFPCSWT